MNPHQKPQEDVVVSVIQQDRDAAAALEERVRGGRLASEMREGLFDRGHSVQAFARHRLLVHEAGRRDMREGWVLVPREPTSDMLNQANGVSVAVYASAEPSVWTAVNADEARAIWEAMLEALPTEPLGGEG